MATTPNKKASNAMLTTEFRITKAMKVKPVNHAPYTVTIPSTMTETAWLIRLARKGATMLTLASGERVAQLGHAVRMTNTYPSIAPRQSVGRVGSVSGVSLTHVLGESNADLARGNASDYKASTAHARKSVSHSRKVRQVRTLREWQPRHSTQRKRATTMITNPNQTKRPKRLRIALAQCENYLHSQVVAVFASLGIASLVLTVSMAVFAPQPDTLSTVFVLMGSLLMGAVSVVLLCVACVEYADKQEQANTARRNRSHLAQLNYERKMSESKHIHAIADSNHLWYWLNRYKCERDDARQERDEARKQASANAFALIGSLMGDIETK